MKTFFSLFLRPASAILILVLCSCVTEEPSKNIIVANAGIACSEPAAADAGLKVLQEGGNAADALVAVGFAMAVTYPRAGNLGGGGFIIYRDTTGNVISLDFRERAPAAASLDMYWDEDGNPDEDKSTIGPLAAGIPGTVAGLFQIHQLYGSKPWAELLNPAIELARNGYEVNDYLARLIKSYDFRLGRFDTSRKIFYRNGQPLQSGEHLVQTDLAGTLERIAVQGAAGFYEGETADKLVTAVNADGGIFSKADLSNYQPVMREPVEMSYRGYSLYSMPPPSSGGLVVQGILNSLTQKDLENTYAHNSADYVAYVSEVEKYWFSQRNLRLGDPDFVQIPFDQFASQTIADSVGISASTTAPFPSRDMDAFTQIQNEIPEATETTHISVIDDAGNAISMTYTLNGNFGCGFVAEGTGVLLNNEMDDFTSKPGHPNMYGLVQGWANTIEPGKRMLSAMTPTIVSRDGELIGALGTPGGPTIITTVLQIILNKIDYDMTLADALSAGRFHQQWLPDQIYLENTRFDPAVLEELESRGFSLAERSRIADIQAIWRVKDGWEVSSDPRGNGYPVGF